MEYTIYRQVGGGLHLYCASVPGSSPAEALEKRANLIGHQGGDYYDVKTTYVVVPAGQPFGEKGAILKLEAPSAWRAVQA